MNARRGWIIAGSGAAFVVLVVLWHLGASSDIVDRVKQIQNATNKTEFEATVDFNAWSNSVSIAIATPPKQDDQFLALGAALGELAVKAAGPTVFETALSLRARQTLDLYAILIPYKVTISTAPAGPEAQARILAKRQQQKMENAVEDAKRLAIARAYSSQYMQLTGVRAYTANDGGKVSDAVGGTIVNMGPATLNKVTIRIYFLDAAGKRIGEHDYTPVLVSVLALDDNTPLRPGYKRDFGYFVGAVAPAAWSRRIEFEVVDIDIQGR